MDDGEELGEELGEEQLRANFKESLRRTMSKTGSLHSKASEKFSVPAFARESLVAGKFDLFEERIHYLESSSHQTIVAL